MNSRGEAGLGANVYIGGQNPGEPRTQFNGMIDDVYFYNGVLTEAQIQQHFIKGGTEPVFPQPNEVLLSTDPITYLWNPIWTTEGFFDNYTLYVAEAEAGLADPVPTTYLHRGVITDMEATSYDGYAGSYDYGEDYYWRVDVTTYEPNDVDPNNVVIDIPRFLQGSPVRFFGPRLCAELSISGNVSNQPDPIDHSYVPKDAVFTVAIKSDIEIESIRWFKVVGAQDDLVDPDLDDQLDIEITHQPGVYEILPLPHDVPAATETSLTIPAAVPQYNGRYYARVKVVDPQGLGNGCEMNSAAAELYVRDDTHASTNYMVHRYGFDGDVNDSIGNAHGVVYDLGEVNHEFTADGRLRLSNTDLTSGPNKIVNPGDPNEMRLLLDPEGAYAELPNGIISALGKAATIMVWFTWENTDEGWQRVFDFGVSAGGEGFATGNTSIKEIGGQFYLGSISEAQEYVMYVPQVGDGTEMRFESIVRPPDTGYMIHANNALLKKGDEVCVAVTLDGATQMAKLYLNGNLLGTSTWPHDLANLHDVNNWLGRSQWNDLMFSGTYNELRIYDIPLSSHWVKAYYEQGPDNYTSTPNPCIWDEPNPMDFDGNCVVDILDFAIFAEQWLECGRLYGCN